MKRFYILFIAIFICSGCRVIDSAPETGNLPKASFQIILQETGEVVLDDTHFDYYEIKNNDHVLHLNESGSKHLENFVTMDTRVNPSTPFRTLYLKMFSVKLNGTELYSGKFFSLMSSQGYNGVVIMDVVVINSTKTLTITLGYPTPGFYQGNDPRNSEVLFAYLESLGKLRK